LAALSIPKLYRSRFQENKSAAKATHSKKEGYR
jgi:hypothetical protein